MKNNKKDHLTKDDRKIIDKMLMADYKQKEIAKVLKRGKSTISEEIKKGKCPDGIYRWEKANHRAYIRQYNKKMDCLIVAIKGELQRYIIEKIKKKISPEDISDELKNSKNNLEYVSAKAIRKFIHKRRPDLERYLFWNRNNKKSGPKKQKTKYLGDSDRKFVDERNVDFKLNEFEYGHWEGDFIVSKHNSYVLLVLVERYSKYTIIDILPNRKNTLVNERISSLLKNLKVKSLTLDNDIAFQHWKVLEKQLNCNIYFTHPYCSWEKGLVENTNRWIREFVPKKSDIKKIKKEKILCIQNWFNNKPRKVLEGFTAFETMMFEEKNVRISSILLDCPVRIGG